jgi:tRNA(Ile)-lysidine synthetase-like protein
MGLEAPSLKSTSSRYVVAVSGGVDSVALLHMLTTLTDLDLVVAHFDHGIRQDSASDADFVSFLAAKYDLPFFTKREELGINASEDLARTRRYEFLRHVARENNAKLMTAHHADDAIETVAINLTRGTGWRGLAVLDSDVVRPLVDITKQEILDYAKRHQLEWREDSTNASDAYLRNRLRHKAVDLDYDTKRQLLALRAHQIDLKKKIDSEIKNLVGPGPDYSRYFLTHIKSSVALECLRQLTLGRLTRPQLARILIAIKTAKSGSTYQAGDGIELSFTSRNFVVKLIK